MKKTEKIIIAFIFVITLIACAIQPQEKPVQSTEVLMNSNLVNSPSQSLSFSN